MLSRCSFAVRSTAHTEILAAVTRTSSPAALVSQQHALRSVPIALSRGICRGFATDGDHEPTPSLREALQAEIDFELENPSAVENLPSEPPSPWTLTESLGDSALVLKRPFNSEEIIVTVIADEAGNDEPGRPDQETPLDPEEQRDFDDLDVGIVAEARIIRNNNALDINFRTDGTYVQVLDVSLGSPDDAGSEKPMESQTEYAGPRYEELDEVVQHAFDDYLQMRGITAEFGEYLMKLTEDKEQREYLHWLQKVHKNFT